MRSMPLTPNGEAQFVNAIASAIAGARFGAVQALAAWPVLLGRVMFYLLILVVLAALWDKVASEQVSPLAGMLPPGGLAVYVGVTEWVTLSVVAIQQRLEDDIRNGALEPYLLRPKSYLLQRIAPAMGETMVRLAVLGCGRAGGARDVGAPAAGTRRLSGSAVAWHDGLRPRHVALCACRSCCLLDASGFAGHVDCTKAELSAGRFGGTDQPL